jgi:hypothetical protein
MVRRVHGRGVTQLVSAHANIQTLDKLKDNVRLLASDAEGGSPCRQACYAYC